MSSSAQKINHETRPDVFGYHEYKIFLRDYFNYLKIARTDFSIRRLALQSGISSGYLPTILNGQADITAKALEKILPFLDLDESEASYLRLLSKVSVSSSQEERFEALQNMQKYKKFAKLNPDQSKVLNYFSKWFFVAIREMTNLKEFRLDPKWIHEKLNFSVPISEITKAVEFLLEHKLIRFKPDGTVATADDRIKCEGDIYRFVLTHFHNQFFTLASESIDNTKKDRRHIIGHTMVLTEEKFAEAIGILEEAREKIAHLSREESSAEAVFHFMMLGFPLTKPEGENE